MYIKYKICTHPTNILYPLIHVCVAYVYKSTANIEGVDCTNNDRLQLFPTIFKHANHFKIKFNLDRFKPK